MEEPKFDNELLLSQQSKYAPKDEDSVKEKVLSKEKVFSDLFSKVGRLKPFFEDFKTIFSLIKDCISGKYRKIPFTTIASLSGVLLYVLSPFDLIFDGIPVLGYVDDVALLAFAIKVSGKDLDDYRSWKATQPH